jgi:hypothetical protein
MIGIKSSMAQSREQPASFLRCREQMTERQGLLILQRNEEKSQI